MTPDDNPYAAPSSDDPHFSVPPRLTVRLLAELFGITTVCGAALGGLTNAVNGGLSPQYFSDVMGWSHFVWPAAIGQGVLEGAMRAAILGAIFLVILAVLSRPRCSRRTATRYIGLTFCMALGFWLLGGATAVAFAWQFPSYCNAWLFGDVRSWPAFGCYAWVRGSIWGVTFGGMFSVFMTTALYGLRHRRMNQVEYERLLLNQQAGSAG